MRKAIIVSPQEYYDFFEQGFPEWDIQHPVLTIEQMWDELSNNVLDENSEIVVLNDVYYDDNSEELEQAIITMAGAALVLVIANEKFEKAIIQKISFIAQRDSLDISNFWFISREQPIEEIQEAFEAYFSNRPVADLNPSDYIQDNIAYQETSNPENLEQGNPYENNPYLENPDAELINQVQNQQEQERLQKIEDHNQYVENFKSVDYEGDGYTGIERNGMIVASTSAKGGSGKSTVALCTSSMLYHSSRLAYESGQSERPLEICVVDLDTRDGQIGFLLSEWDAPTALSIFTSQDFSRNNIKRNLVYNERLGIHALLAPKRMITAAYTTPEFYRDLIMKLRTMFDIVVLDTSVNHTDPLLYDVVLPVSDAVLFVTDMSRSSVFGMTRWIHEITLPIERGGTAGITKEKIGVVVNKSMGDVGFNQSNLVEAAAEVPLIASIPMDSKAILAATNNDRLNDIVLNHPSISPAYFGLAQKIIQGSVPLQAPYNPNPEPEIKGKRNPLNKKKKLFQK